MRPSKIISGGQTGADQGALEAARHLGIRTGGWMPKDFLTENGPRPEFAAMYDLQAIGTYNYAVRTRKNARESEGTVWISNVLIDGDSKGFICTKKWADHYKRPFMVVTTGEQLQAWCRTWNIDILNVAGPRASHDRFAHERAVRIILRAFKGET